MEQTYTKLVGSEALQQEFSKLAEEVQSKAARPSGGFSRMFASKPKAVPTQLDTHLYDYLNGNTHALISVAVENGKPLVKYCDVGDMPRVSPNNVRSAVQAFVESFPHAGNWRDRFQDHQAAFSHEHAAWTDTSSNDRELHSPGTEIKSAAERFEEGKRFVEGVHTPAMALK